MDTVSTLKPGTSMVLIFSRSVSVRMGLLIFKTLQFSAFSSSRLPCAPTYTVVEVTTFSRSASMGGFVTWANICLKYSNSGGRVWLRTASGVSLPIAPEGSAPFFAMGSMMVFKSS